MAPIASAEVIAELEETVRVCQPARAALILRRVTDLMRGTAGRLTTHQLAVFDEVLIRLIDRVETATLTEFSTALVDLGPTRLEAAHRLAHHEEAAVAAPLLARSKNMPEKDLLEIAESRGAAHTLAIAKRDQISEALSDALLARADTTVTVQLARNAGARFSREGYAKLAAMAERNDEIGDLLVTRADVPEEILRRLLLNLPRSVRARLLKVAVPSLRSSIEAIIEEVEAQIRAKPPETIDYSEAQARIGELNKAGKLNDSSVNRLATWREYRDLVAALSQLATAPVETIEPLLHEGDCYGMIVACRASRLNWNTTLAVISNRPGQPKPSEKEMEQARQAFESLNLSAAQRLIRFGSVRDFALKVQPAGDAKAIAGAL